MQQTSLEQFEDGLKRIAKYMVTLSEYPMDEYIEFACNIIRDITGNYSFSEDFMETYCARSVHDAHEGGLSEHTFKVFSELLTMLFYGNPHNGDTYYGNIQNKVDMPALIIGCILHDVGKTMEYKKDSNGDYHYVSHNMLGIYMVSKLEQEIVYTYGEETFFRILSIIGQHHGDFGEKPQTIEAYLVHLADYQETKLQILEETLEPTSELVDYNESNYIIKSKYIPYRLSVRGNGKIL